MSDSKDWNCEEVGTSTDREAVSSTEKMRPPTVSIIVTNYNYERFITDCLESILAQTIKAQEVIVIDDCSTDRSVAAIERFIAGHEDTGHFELHQQSTNGGQMNAFIEGFRRSSGAFVVFVDADDWLFPDFVETHLAAHLNPEFTAGMTCSNEIIIDGENRVLTGSIEKWHRAPRPRVQIGAQVPVKATPIERWRSAWQLGPEPIYEQLHQPLLYVAPDGNELREWIWSTTSAIMFRRGVLDVVLRDSFRDVRICADFVVFQFAHVIGGTILIQSCHVGYRRHGNNNFAFNATIGRGTMRGMISGHDFPKMLIRIQGELLENFEQLCELLGRPRMLQLLAAFAPISSTPRVLRKIGIGRPAALVQYLGLLTIKKIKITWLRLKRLARFI